MAFDFKSFIASIESWGLMDALLPFILIFVVIFAILQKSELLGKGKKQFNVIVSAIIGLIVVIPHVLGTYPAGFDVVSIINKMIPQISLIIIALLMLLLMLGLAAGAAIPGIVAVIAGLLVLLILLGTSGWLYGLDWVYDIFGTEVISFLIIILVFGAVIWFITAEPGTAKTGANIGKFVSEIFGKK